MGIAKVTLNGETLMDVTGKTVEASSMLSGKTALDKKGDNVTGSITSKTAADLTASGATVTVPAGYYAASASKAVTTVAHPNPTAAINSTTGVVTATHVQTAGYVTAGTTTGTLSLSTQAAKTVTPTESIQRAVSAGYYTTGNISVAAISSTYVGTGVTRVSAADLTASGSTVTVPAGYYATQATKNVASASAFPPAISLNSSTGVITGTNTFAAGYYAASTTTSTFQLTSKAAATYYPSTADQTITSNQYLIGAQTIKSVTLTNLTASNIVSGVTVKVGDSANASRITQVTGTYTDSDFVITLSYNETTDMWEPDCTFAEAKAAYDAGKNIAVVATNDYTPAYFTYSEDDSCFYYAVQEQSSSGAFGMVVAVEKTYYLDSDGVHDDGGTNLYETIMDTATPSQVLSGARFHNASGYQTGTMPINTAFPPALSLNSSTGVITGTNSFSEGHYSAGTQTSTLSLATQAASTWTPGTTNKTIASGQYLTGAQTILGDANLVASNIASGVSIFGVTGTHQGGPTCTVTLTNSGDQYNGYVVYNNIRYYTAGDTIEVPKNSSILITIIYGVTNILYANGQQIAGGQDATVNDYAYVVTTNTEISFSLSRGVSTGQITVPEIEITENGRHNVDGYVYADVQVGGGEGGFTADQIALRTISGDISGNASYIVSSAFAYCSALISVNFPSATSIGYGAFFSCRSLKTPNFPSATIIGVSAFANCSALTSVNFPAATSILSSAFAYCSALTTISFPVVTSIGNSAFFSCSNLTTISFPVTTSIANHVFYNCFSLTTANFPSATGIGAYAFTNCNTLTTISFPAVTSIGSNAFSYCGSLKTISFPAATSIGSYAFFTCINLMTISFPVATSIGNYAFAYCSALISVNFPSATSIGGSVFQNCYNLLSLYLLGSSVPTLNNVNAFTSTPISNYTTSTGGVYGSIFVRESLADAFKSATNWATYSSRIVGLTDAEIEALDS